MGTPVLHHSSPTSLQSYITPVLHHSSPTSLLRDHSPPLSPRDSPEDARGPSSPCSGQCHSGAVCREITEGFLSAKILGSRHQHRANSAPAEGVSVFGQVEHTSLVHRETKKCWRLLQMEEI